ncbi:hypothetical protein fHeYen902_224 [Yersinia phage fHe-Yen9-02]|nr:hypothetical protein fHeYen902_224 [Yersinia phage fHe-Yen9-02]
MKLVELVLKINCKLIMKRVDIRIAPYQTIG